MWASAHPTPPHQAHPFMIRLPKSLRPARWRHSTTYIRFHAPRAWYKESGVNAIYTRQRSCDSVVFYHDSRTWYKKTNMKSTCDSVLATAWLCTIFCTIVQNFFLVGSRDLGSAPASLRLIKPPFLGLFFTLFCPISAPKLIPSPVSRLGPKTHFPCAGYARFIGR